MTRTLSYRRHHRYRVINRKKKIIKQTSWNVKFDGMLAKGKIHCGCGLCKFDRHAGYELFRYSKKLGHMQADINDYFTR